MELPFNGWAVTKGGPRETVTTLREQHPVTHRHELRLEETRRTQSEGETRLLLRLFLVLFPPPDSASPSEGGDVLAEMIDFCFQSTN